MALGMYCQNYQTWLEATEHIRAEGLVVKTTEGGTKTNLYMTIAQKAQDAMMKIIIEFGLTPSSRTRIKTNKAEEDKKKQKDGKDFSKFA